MAILTITRASAAVALPLIASLIAIRIVSAVEKSHGDAGVVVWTVVWLMTAAAGVFGIGLLVNHRRLSSARAGRAALSRAGRSWLADVMLDPDSA